MDVPPEDTLAQATTVAVPVERAFATFGDGLAGWWPRESTWAQDALDTIAIEPRAGGRCFERGPHGFHCGPGLADGLPADPGPLRRGGPVAAPESGAPQRVVR